MTCSTPLSFCGEYIFVGLSDGNIVILNCIDQPPCTFVKLPAHSCAVNCMALSASGILASGGNDGTVRIWELSPVAIHCEIKVNSTFQSITCLSWASQKLELAIGSLDGYISVWNVDNDSYNAEMIVKLSSSAFFGVTSFAWSWKGDYIAFGDSAGNIRVY